MLIICGPDGSYACEGARALSHKQHVPLACTNEIISSLAGVDISELSVNGSTQLMRSWEHDVTASLLQQVEEVLTMHSPIKEETQAASLRSTLTDESAISLSSGILCLGAGCLGDSLRDSEFEDIRAQLSRVKALGARVICVNAPFGVLVKRTGLAGPRFASVASPRSLFFSFMTQRTALYEYFADVTIDSGEMNSNEVCEALCSYLRPSDHTA